MVLLLGAAAGQLWTLSSWPAMDSEASTTRQLSFYAAAAVPPSPVCSTQSQTLRFQLDQFFFQGFIFAQKIASFAQNLCFPLLRCLQMFCPFCINLHHEGFAGNWKEARSFYLWLSSSTCKRGRRRLAVASRRATRPPPPPPHPPCRLR